MDKKYTILMALMGLEIGGAETHVVELVKQLNKEGHRIIVASNGGVYVDELDKIGVKHYKVPMNRRSIPNMYKSYYLLKDIILKENIDIVHSHARIPSFICGVLKRKMDFIFVTTAHWVFYTGMGFKYITNWGQKVVAVSDDIKEYLMKNYRVYGRDIFVTINGIDTNKFSPKTVYNDINEEFGLKEGERRIVYVSRMDESRALVAKQLIEITSELDKEIENLKIIIVGGGDVFDKLNAMADDVNKALNRQCIVMTGSRVDINQLIMAGDIFVGVSRAALESMAAEKPTIVAGNEGYIGLFREDNFDIAEETNFCCRGCDMPTKEMLKRDITFAMTALTDEERLELGKYSREIIFKHYSVGRMAQDCLRAYDAAYDESQTKQYNVVMSGYYGFNNSGDDAILLSIHSNLDKTNKNIKVTVLANNPVDTGYKYDVRTVNRYNAMSVIKAIKNCDVLLSGGGSLLQDRTSTRSLLYYLSIIKLAKMMGKKVMIYANGIGPVEKKNNRNLVKKVIDKIDLITLREENSLEELKNMGVDNINAFITADPVFTMDGIDRLKSEEILKREGIPVDKPIVGVSVRNWKAIDKFLEFFAMLCDKVYEETGRTILFIPMQLPNDMGVSKIVQKAMKKPSYILAGELSPTETMGIIGAMDFVMSMRLHTLIFAARQRIPLIGFSYDPKIDYYLNEFGMPNGGETEKINIDEAFKMIEDIIANRGEYVKKLDASVTALEKLANKNEDYLLELLEEQKS